MPTPDRSGVSGVDTVLSDPRRLAAVRRLMSPGPRGEHLDRLTRLAASLLEAPYAQVSLLSEQQHVWSLYGAGESDPDQGTTAADSLCTVTVRLAAPLAVEDATEDERVRLLPPVAGGRVRAYLGVPVLSSEARSSARSASTTTCRTRGRPRRSASSASWPRASPPSSSCTRCRCRRSPTRPGSSSRWTPPRSAASTSTAPPATCTGTSGS